MQVSDIIIRRLWVVRRLSLTVSAYAFARFVGGGIFCAHEIASVDRNSKLGRSCKMILFRDQRLNN